MNEAIDLDLFRIDLINKYNRESDLGVFERAYQNTYKIKGYGPHFRGEISEVYLEVLLKLYAKSKNEPCITCKSLILPIGRGKTTEIDLLIASQRNIIILESKSFSGKCELRDKGSIYRNGRFQKDVYEQNIKHAEHFYSLFKTCIIGKQEGILGNAMFFYSQDEILDKREGSKHFPLLTKDNLFDYLDKELMKGGVAWDLEKLTPVLKQLKENKNLLEEAHMRNVGLKRR